MAGVQPEGQNRGMHRTITGSRVNLTEIENLINAARVPEADETSSVSSSHTGGRSSNIIQIVPGKKNVKSAMQAALAEASGYADPNTSDVDMQGLTIGSDDEAYEFSSPNTPRASSSDLKHVKAATVASEPLEGAGVTRRAYQESSAPPEGAGGYQTGEFVAPVFEEQKAPSQPKREALGQGMYRTITGSSLRLAELNDLLEKANDSECPGTPGSRSGKTPRSQSGLSLTSRSSSIVQIVPGCKDIRTALATAITEGEEGSRRLSLDTVSEPQPGSLGDRQSLEGPGATPGSVQSQAASQALGGSGARASLTRPRSIRRLMSEKSIGMDTVYSGALLEELPTDPLEGTGVVVGRKYQEAKHGPQGSFDSPRDFPRVVNGVPTTGGGEEETSQKSSVPPSPMRKATGPYRTISGSNMDLKELESILEKATIPKSERMSLDGKSSYGGTSQTTHRSIPGRGLGVTHGSQVFGEELIDEPKQTFGIRAQSLNAQELQELVRRASVTRSEPDSPRSTASSGIPA